MALTGWALLQSSNVSPVSFEPGFYIPGDDILHSHRRENLNLKIIFIHLTFSDRLCGLVVRVSDCRHRVPEFNSRRYQIF
jgi:hypothetical protein